MGKQEKKPEKKGEEKPPNTGRPWGEPESASSACVHQKMAPGTWSTNTPWHNGPCYACKLQERLAELDNMASDPSSPGHWDKESIMKWIPPTQEEERKKEESNKTKEGG